MVEIIGKIYGSNLIRLQNSQLNWIGAKEGDEIVIRDDTGKHGRFISIWKRE